MKRILSTVIFSFFLSLTLFSQDRNDYNLNAPVGISSVNEAASIADQIVKAVGLRANFKIAEADVPNALAVLQNGQRYILYNPGFVNQLAQATGTHWAAVSVLAHEIGHHLYNSLNGLPNRGMATELEADQFSGYVLEKMGAKLNEAQAAMSMLATPYATSTHPAKMDRINSIANGYELAGGVVPEKKTDNETVLPSSSIVARLEFSRDPGSDYFITKALNIVSVEENDVSVIGHLSKSGDLDFPYIISVSDGYRLYISSAGQIVTAKGTVVGKVTKG